MASSVAGWEVAQEAQEAQEEMRQRGMELNKLLASGLRDGEVRLTAAEIVKAEDELLEIEQRLASVSETLDTSASASSGCGTTCAARPAERDPAEERRRLQERLECGAASSSSSSSRDARGSRGDASSSGGGGTGSSSSDGSRRPTSDVIALAASRTKGPTEAEMPALTLGHWLMGEAKPELSTTLAQRLRADEPPLRSPHAIVAPIERVLREHLRRAKERRKAEMADNADFDQGQLSGLLHYDLAQALLALQLSLLRAKREDTGGKRSARGSSGASGKSSAWSRASSHVMGKVEQERMERQLASARGFQHLLLNSAAQDGKRVTVHHQDQTLELTIKFHWTFDKLIATAANYWHLDPTRLAIAAEDGVQFIRRMGLLEGLQLAPKGTELYLIPLHARREQSTSWMTTGPWQQQHEQQQQQADAPPRKRKLISEADVDAVVKANEKRREGIDTSMKAALRAAGTSGRQAVLRVAEDADHATREEMLREEKAAIRVRWFGFRTNWMSKCQMACGIIQTAILCLLFFIVAYADVDIPKERQFCSALTHSFDQEFTYLFGPSKLSQISSMAEFQEWMILTYPQILFNQSANGRPPDFKPPIVIRDRNVLIGGIRLSQVRGEANDHRLCQPQLFMPEDTYFPATRNGTSLIPMYPTYQGAPVWISPFQPVLAGELVRDIRADRMRGDVGRCYLDRPEHYRSGSSGRYGPMAEDDGGAPVDAQAKAMAGRVEVPLAKCYPECNGKGLQGVQEAFVFRSRSELGYPYNLVTSTSISDIRNGGYAITASSEINFDELSLLMVALQNYSWLDRQTLAVSIDQSFLNPHNKHLAHVQIVMEMRRTGSASVKVACIAGRMEMFKFDLFVACQWVLFAWLVCRLVALLYLRITGLLAGPRAGTTVDGVPAQPVRCEITTDLIIEVLMICIGLAAQGLRIFDHAFASNSILSQMELSEDWPPPYMAQLPEFLSFSRASVQMFGVALLLCILRFVLFYSLVSTRLFVMRLTMGRATLKLIPTLLFLIVAVLTYAIGGNLLYPTSEAWRTFYVSLATVVYMLRRPAAMPFENMQETSQGLWPSRDLARYPSAVSVVFFASFTAIALFILMNFYRAVIINEYAEVSIKYEELDQPEDLKPDPWPSLNVRDHYRAFMKARNERLYQRQIKRIVREDMLNRMEHQKELAAKEKRGSGPPQAAEPASGLFALRWPWQAAKNKQDPDEEQSGAGRLAARSVAKAQAAKGAACSAATGGVKAVTGAAGSLGAQAVKTTTAAASKVDDTIRVGQQQVQQVQQNVQQEAAAMKGELEIRTMEAVEAVEANQEAV